MRIPLDFFSLIQCGAPSRFERRHRRAGTGELLKSNSFESPGDRKGSAAMGWWDEGGRGHDVKG